MRPRPALTGKIPTKKIWIDIGTEKKESGKMSKTEHYMEMKLGTQLKRFQRIGV